jgi:hypothetical protein
MSIRRTDFIVAGAILKPALKEKLLSKYDIERDVDWEWQALEAFNFDKSIPLQIVETRNEIETDVVGVVILEEEWAGFPFMAESPHHIIEHLPVLLEYGLNSNECQIFHFTVWR